jgi:uncharacterized tellurite resistance protein B-like protein
MASVLANFFQKYLAERADEVEDHNNSRRARLAAAALLVEVTTVDGEFTDTERRTLLSGLQAQFALDATEAADLLALAESQTVQATDLHQFTLAVNKQFSEQQKSALLEELWRAAYADTILHRHEEYLIRKIGNLLHLSNAAVLAARHRVQQAKGS